VAVIGGGAIGCEFASTFADLGAKVTILEFLPKILPGLDADVANVVVRSFKKKQIDIRTGVKVTGHTPNGSGGTTVEFGEGESVEVDACIVSVGRRPYADQLGLGGTAVKVTDRGFVDVDEFCRTGEPGVYAIGDLIDTPQLAHVGYAEAILVVKQILGGRPDAGHVRPRAVGDLLPPRSGVGRPGRGRLQGGRHRRRRRQAPVQVQQPGADRR
jgi:dihydrolipoamide dehydrogenase